MEAVQQQKKYMYECPSCKSRFFSEPVTLGVRNGQLTRIHPICTNCFGKCRAGHTFGYGEACNICGDPRRRFNLIRYEIDPDDPTFGLTSTGSATYPTATFGNMVQESTANKWQGYIVGFRFALSAPMTVTALLAYYDGAVGNAKFAIFTDATTKPANLVVGSASGAIATGWNTRSVTATYLAAATYWLVWMNDDNPNLSSNVNHASETVARSYKLYTYGDWPASWPSGSTDGTFPRGSIYAKGAQIMNYIKTTKATLSEAAKSVTSMSFYSHATGNLYAGIYTDSGGPAVLKWTSGSIAASVPGWTTVNISAGTPNTLALAAGDYWLAWQWDSVNAGPSYTLGGANRGAYLAQAYGAFPDPMTGETLSTETWSLYVTYLQSTITGVVRDLAGTPIASATVWLFKSSDKSYQQVTTSDGSGNYTFYVDGTVTMWFIRAYKDGSPNLFGTTDDDLVGA